MDKYDRDPWHNAETLPLWFIVAVVVVLLCSLAFAEPVRLPRPRAPRDAQIWGALINQFLRVSHNEDGTIKESALEGFFDPNGYYFGEEKIEDFVGGMLSGTETLITVTYEDETGDIDFVVDNNLHNYSWTNVDATDLKTGSVTQAYDATLLSIALLGTAADKMLYATDVDTWAEAAITAFARTILDDANAATARTSMGLGTIATYAGNQNLQTTDQSTFARVYLGNDGLFLRDTNASHWLAIVPSTNLTANRILYLATGDAQRTITLTGNPTLADWFDQSVKQAATPTLAGLTLTGDILPSTNMTCDLGSPTKEWDLAYIQDIKIDYLNVDTTAGKGVESSLIPADEASYLLGSSDYRWNEIWGGYLGIDFIRVDGSTISTITTYDLALQPGSGTVLINNIDLDGSITMDASETVDGRDVSADGAVLDACSSNWDDAFTYSEIGHLPLAGGTLTGHLKMGDIDQIILGENELVRIYSDANDLNIRNVGVDKDIIITASDGGVEKLIRFDGSENIWKFGTTSISDDGTNTFTPAQAKSAYTHSQIAGGDSVHVSTTENTQWDDAYSKRVDTWTAPLSYSAQAASITQADTDTDGYLSQTDWDIFNGKQAQGDVLDDLNTLGAVTGDNYFLVGTAAGVLDWETAGEAKISIGLGISSDVTFNSAVLRELKMFSGDYIGWWFGGARKSYIMADDFSDDLNLYATTAMQFSTSTNSATLSEMEDAYDYSAVGHLPLAGGAITGSLTVDTDTLVVNASGYTDKVGIGTASPRSKLEVAGDIWVIDSGSNPRIVIGDSSGAGSWSEIGWNSASDFMHLGTEAGGVNALVLTESGNVGIGTSSPNSVFHIKANVPGIVGSHHAGQKIIQNPADDVNACAVITGYESDGSGNPDQQLWYLGSSSAGNEDIIFLNRRDAKLALGTSGTSRITILGNGNVGIGTTTPSEALDLADGNLATTGNLTDGTNSLTIAEANDAYDYSQVGHLPSAGGTVTGDITIGDGTAATRTVTFDTDGNDGTFSYNHTTEKFEFNKEIDAGVYGFEGKHFYENNNEDCGIVFLLDQFSFKTKYSSQMVKFYGASSKTTPYIAINDLGILQNFWAEGDNDPNLLYCEGSTDRVGIGDSTPDSKLEIAGAITLQEMTAPGTPAANKVVIYVDSADGDLKAKDDNGEVKVLADFTVD